MAVSAPHAACAAGDGRPVTVIEPPRRWMPLDLHELIPSDGLPYPLWSFAGLVPWTFFSGFAHGYQTLSDVSVVTYKCSDVYSPNDERAVRWDDSDIAIEWPIREAIVSHRDATAPRLRDLFPVLPSQLDR